MVISRMRGEGGENLGSLKSANYKESHEVFMVPGTCHLHENVILITSHLHGQIYCSVMLPEI